MRHTFPYRLEQWQNKGMLTYWPQTHQVPHRAEHTPGVPKELGLGWWTDSLTWVHSILVLIPIPPLSCLSCSLAPLLPPSLRSCAPKDQSLDVFSPYTTPFVTVIQAHGFKSILIISTSKFHPDHHHSKLHTRMSGCPPDMCPLGGPTGVSNKAPTWTTFSTTSHDLLALLLPYSLSYYQPKYREIVWDSSFSILSCPISTSASDSMSYIFPILPSLCPHSTASVLVKAFWMIFLPRLFLCSNIFHTFHPPNNPSHLLIQPHS